jgi:hypothetical protein
MLDSYGTSNKPGASSFMVEENVRKGNVTVKGKEALKWRL